MTTQGGASFDPDMRAGDADRERLVEQLREHHAAGRLTLDEFDERMTKAYEAKTYGELRALTRDLPVDLAQLNFEQARPRTGQAPRGPQGRPVEVRRDESGRMQINIDNQAIQDRINHTINHHLERHQQRWAQHQERHERRAARQQERWQQQVARRRRGGWLSFGSWLSLSVLLTGIWLISNLAGGGNWGDFWPVWPIGITGVLMLSRSINRRH
jgi:hypothetical protein